MKKIVSLLVLVAMVLSIFSMTAFAVDQSTLTKAQYEKLKEAADYVELCEYHVPFLVWVADLYGYAIQNTPQYVYYRYDYDENDQQALLPYCANIPVSELKTLTYKATPAPKGFYESFIEPKLENNSSNYWDNETSTVIHYETVEVYDKNGKEVSINYGYDKKNGTYTVYDPARGKEPDYDYSGFVDNGDATYSFYYGEIDYDKTYFDETKVEWVWAKYDRGIAITLKFENDGIALVSDKKVDKLPTKYSEVPTATTATETKVVYDAEKGITFADNNNFEAGTTVTAKEVKNGTAFDTAKKALNGVSNKYVVFDFSAVKNGATVQPKGKVKVTMSIPETLSAEGLKMFYVSDKGKKEEIKITVDKKNKTVTAELEHFSTYVLANVSSSPKTGDNSNVMLWVILLWVSSFAFGIVSFSRIRTCKASK